jgi:cytidylate kinase
VTPHPVVTIDGPAGSGKSSVARRLAERLGYGFVSSGAMYRAVAWRVLGGASLEAALAGCRIEFRGLPTEQRVLVGGEDVTEELQSEAVGRLASALSERPEVRRLADALQRQLAQEGPMVVEGRDAGTVVFPEAACKFYLDAPLEVRTERRLSDVRARGETTDAGTVRSDLAGRDARDRTRALAPLVPAPEAVHLDSGRMSLDEVIDRMADEVERACSTPR